MSKLLQALGVPEWMVWAVVLLAALAAALAHGHDQRMRGDTDGAARVQGRWDAEKAARDQAVIQAQARVISTEHQQAAQAQEVDRHVQAQLAAVAADRDRAVRAAAGLRQQLAAVRADAVPQAAADPGEPAQARALADSLSECSERYSAVAGERDELAVQLGGLIDLLPAEDPAPD